ncbi:MAG: helix-turn-helix domain-containing protein [Alphaproteobacteria bacterium]|nr:helix-turn-helix domain-containing protein [Alphaproteobacteria bacterium]
MQPCAPPPSASDARLPGLLHEIEQATDRETALLVASVKGGQTVYFAFDPAPDSWLSQIVGQVKARAIGRALVSVKGDWILVPKGPEVFWFRRSEILRLSMQGMSRNKIAQRLGIHMRTVQCHRRRLRDEGLLLPVIGNSGTMEDTSK